MSDSWFLTMRTVKVRVVTAVAVAVVFLLFNYLIVRSQNGTTDLKGKTQQVLAAANRSVDAGEIVFKVDTDHDGVSDEDELNNGLNPNDASDADGDGDGDGLSNADEIALGTSPNNTDSDGDGFSDAEEVRLGFNPLDPASHPQPGAAVVSIRVNPRSMALNVNSLFGASPAQLTVTGELSDGTTVDLTRTTGTNYQSLNTSVALVDDFGSVVGVAPGATSINVTNGTLTAQTHIFVAATTVGQTGVIHFAGGGNALKVDVSGAYAYVACGSAGLRVVDVNDRKQPQLASTLDTPGEAKGVKVVGNLAYIADGPSGLQIVDVTDPTSPILLGSVDTPGDARDVVVYGLRAYVADGSSGLQIIDVTTPQAPSLLGSLNVSGTVNGVDVSGDFAVVAMGTDGVRLADVSNPASPLSLGSVATTDARDVKCVGAIAYVADVGFKVVDFSAPSAPLLVSSLPDFTSGDLFDVAKAGNLVFGADRFAFRITAPIIDVSNPAAATVRGYVSFFDFGGGSSSIAADDRFVYVCTPSNVLYIGQYFQPDDVTDIAPTITITSPQNGQSLMEGTALNITADAADDVLVKSVTFMMDGQAISTDTAPLYRDNTHTVPLDVTSVIIGATATDQAGNVETAEITLNVSPDPPPTVSIASPAAGSQLIQGHVVTISANASDNIGVDHVVIKVNGAVVSDRSESPYTVLFTVPLGVASLTIEATAFDNLGRQNTASGTFVSIFNPPPVVNVTSPEGGTTTVIEGQALNLAADATDDGQVTRVDFVLIDFFQITLASFTTPPYMRSWTVPVDGSATGDRFRTLLFIATDNLGDQTTVTRTIIIKKNSPPIVTITSPAEGAQLVEGQTVTITADASDDLRVSQVVFTLNGQAPLTFTSPPYRHTFTVSQGITSLNVQVAATDTFQQTSTATRTFTVLANQPPSVTLTSPADGAQVYGGQTVTLAADASDDHGVAQVVFNVNGVEVGGDSSPPYNQAYAIPVGATSLTVQATAIDIFGKSSSATRTLPVLDALTTVIGLVTDLSGAPIPDATVTLDNASGFTTTTDSQGAFSLGGVATTPEGTRVSVSVVDATGVTQGHSALLPPVPAGTTDLGIIVLASQASTTLPATPSATARGDFSGDSLDDLFVGVSDRQSRIYVSDGGGHFDPSLTLTLPFGAVRSGASLDLIDDGYADILAQPVGQSGSVIAAFTDGAGGLLSTATISTGLVVESESIAARGDVIGSRLRVLAFLSTAGGTRLTVVFSDGAGGFTAPIMLPVDASAQLRSLKLYDVNDDLLPDLIAIKQLPGGDARLVVFLRISETEFGAGIESAITVRDTSPSTTLMVYAVGDFDADLLEDVAVIGDDRVRIYKGDGTGAYTLLSDVPLPAGVTASAIATPYGGAVAVGENLIVVARDSASPDHKMVLLYQNTGFPGNASFNQPARLNYTVPAGATGDSRLLIGHFAGEAFIEEAIVVDGETVTAFVDVVR